MRGASPAYSFKDSLVVQIRVINALIQRSFLSLSGGKPIGFLGVLIEPLLFMAGFIALFLARSSQTAFLRMNISPIAFAISGYCILWGCRFQFRAATSISSNLTLLYHRNVRVLDLLISRGIVQTCFVTVAFLIMFFVGDLWELFPAPHKYHLIFISWLFVAWYGFNLVLLTGVISSLWTFGARITFLLNLLHFFITGSFVMIAWLPSQYQKIFLLFPMVHATEMMRDGFFGQYVVTYYNPLYITAINIAVTCLSLCLVQLYKQSEAAYGKGR